MEPLISEINDMEERGLPELRKFSNAHKARAGIVSVKGIDELSTEKAFRRKATRARDVRDRINAKINEVKDLRDALVNASGVLESRAAVSQVRGQ